MGKITKVDLYSNLVKLGRIKVEDVPQEYKEEVSKIFGSSDEDDSEE